MYTKIEITGIIEVVTGMHIGGSTAYAAIGAVDAPIIKDVRTNLPMIPGSSLKGKLRTLLAKKYNEEFASEPNKDNKKLLRIFGSSEKKAIKHSRVLVYDMFMANEKALRDRDLNMTEVKVENTINRATAVANPRQIERAIRGTEFALNMIYEVENREELEEDIQILADGFRMLKYDYLGGHGSRGYGKVNIKEINLKTVVGDLDDGILNQCQEIVQKALKEE